MVSTVVHLVSANPLSNTGLVAITIHPFRSAYSLTIVDALIYFILCIFKKSVYVTDNASNLIKTGNVCLSSVLVAGNCICLRRYLFRCAFVLMTGLSLSVRYDSIRIAAFDNIFNSCYYICLQVCCSLNHIFTRISTNPLITVPSTINTGSNFPTASFEIRYYPFDGLFAHTLLLSHLHSFTYINQIHANTVFMIELITIICILI